MAKIQLRLCRQLAALPTGRGTALNYLLVVNLRKQICWIIVPCVQIIATKQFKEMYCLHLHAYEFMNLLKILKMKMLRSFEMSLRNYPTTWHNNQKTWSLNSPSVGTSDHRFHVVGNVFISGSLTSLIYCVLFILFFNYSPMQMDVCKADKIVIQDSLEMPLSRRSEAVKLTIMKDR
jgi:hypothetical protein